MSFADNVDATVVAGQVASGTANSGNPVKIGAVYNSSAPTVTAGNVIDAQADVNGNMKVVVENGVTGVSPGTQPSTLIGVQGATGMVPLATVAGLASSGGASYSNAIAPATPAVTTVKSSAGNIYGIVAFNDTASPVFLKIFDVSGSITLGTTACTFQYMIPGNTGGAGFVVQIAGQRSCANSIKYAVTGAISTTDNTGITANTILVDISYN